MMSIDIRRKVKNGCFSRMFCSKPMLTVWQKFIFFNKVNKTSRYNPFKLYQFLEELVSAFSCFYCFCRQIKTVEQLSLFEFIRKYSCFKVRLNICVNGKDIKLALCFKTDGESSS